LFDADDCIDSIVLGMHFVPSKSFIQATNSKEALFNWARGSEKLAEHYQREKVVLGLTGHTHRSDNHLVGNRRVYNVSATNEKPFQRFELP
jgi:Icc-related predicted phosphoesterase